MSQTLVQTFGIVFLSISGAAFVGTSRGRLLRLCFFLRRIAAAIVLALVVKFAPSSGLAAAAVGV